MVAETAGCVPYPIMAEENAKLLGINDHFKGIAVATTWLNYKP
jgi:hypothetical protein